MSDDAKILRNSPKPQCGRCFQPVETATSFPIYDKSVIVGYKLTYCCHGEQMHKEVQASWFQEPGNDKKPFMSTVFDPIVTQSVDPNEAIRDVLTSDLRGKRLAMAEFVEETVRSVVKSQKGFKGFITHWCAKHRVHLMIRHDDIADHLTDRRFLVIDDIEVGHFELPFYADQDGWKWVPSKVTK